uniref:Uncharacterized protein n=1 Tax=Rhizophora mucronata TaxID=61149 RepID=A0A2P2J567_RHIMU
MFNTPEGGNFVFNCPEPLLSVMISMLPEKINEKIYYGKEQVR